MILTLKKARRDNWTKRYFFVGTAAKIGPSLDVTGFPVTGLDAKDELKFEKELGMPKGTLGKGSKYWHTFHIVIDAEGVLLDDSIPENALKIKFLKAQSLVADGTAGLKTNSKAEYVLTNQEAEKVIKNKSRKLRRDAQNIAANMEIDEMKGMVYLYHQNPTHMTVDSIEDFVFEKLEEDPSLFGLLAKDPEREVKVFVLSLVKAGIMEVKGGAYHYEGEAIAYGLEATALFLKDKTNQELRIALEKRLDIA